MDAIMLEKTNCPICNNDEVKKTLDFNPYLVGQCKKCGIWYLKVRENEESVISQYANDNYFQGETVGYSEYQLQEKSLKLTFNRFLKQLNKKTALHGDMLEIGCAYGYFLGEAKKYFNSIEGTDYSQYAVSIAKKTGATVYCGGIELIPPDKTYDFVFLIQVIEHVYSPVEFLNKCVNLIKPGGHLVLATPNIGSGWFKVMGKKWTSFKVPEHVVFYDERSLKNLMMKVGLSNCEKIPYLHAFPLNLVGDKLGFKTGLFSNTNLWIPGTTICVVGQKPV